nr:PIN domain-containing protein [Rhizomicrobium palustre]
MLDTNVLIDIGDMNEPVAARFARHAGQSCTSVLNLVEMERGVALLKAGSEKRRARLAAILEILPVRTFDRRAAAVYGTIIAELGLNRARDFDRMIAAHAIALEAVLVTANTEDFRDIPGLKFDNWAI